MTAIQANESFDNFSLRLKNKVQKRYLSEAAYKFKSTAERVNNHVFAKTRPHKIEF